MKEPESRWWLLEKMEGNPAGVVRSPWSWHLGRETAEPSQPMDTGTENTAANQA